MNDHAHEWALKAVCNQLGDWRVQMWCIQCPEIRTADQAESMLNAAQQLRLCDGCGSPEKLCRQYQKDGAIACCPDCRHARGGK
jgi:hypothetical protein